MQLGSGSQVLTVTEQRTLGLGSLLGLSSHSVVRLGCQGSLAWLECGAKAMSSTGRELRSQRCIFEWF